MQQSVNGILLLDKPEGFTSNAALQQVKRLFNAKKAGHTGSLDPIATGMLPICFGEATKFSQFLLEANKSYAVSATLGIRTTTGDCEGDIMTRQTVAGINHEDIVRVMKHFLGEIQQIPPMYSAIKHQGKPLYSLARRGIEIERKPRCVTLHTLTLDAWDHDQLSFHVHCSKGTYIRTLVEDMGAQLGVGAHVSKLRRLLITPFTNALMYTLSELEKIKDTAGYEGLLTTLLPIESALQSYPAVVLSTSSVFYLRMGQAVRAPYSIDSALVRLISNEKFIGLGAMMSDGRIKPHRLIYLS